MNPITRTMTILATAVVAVAGMMPAAHADGTVTINGVTYQDRGTVTLTDASSSTGAIPDPIGQLVTKVLVGANTCVPSQLAVSIGDATFQNFYGTTDSLYHWQVPAEAEAVGCPNNTVTIHGQLSDQALDGASPPVMGPTATATGKGIVRIVAELWRDYSDAEMAGLSYHTLTMVVTATETDNKTTMATCATKSWTYLPTPIGPYVVGTTPQTKCGA
jgi:hypothetical protein